MNIMEEKLICIHSYCWKYSLTSGKLDILCKAVVEPSLLKFTKALKYPTQSQLFHQTNAFNSTDVCSANSYEEFDFNSLMTNEAKVSFRSN